MSSMYGVLRLLSAECDAGHPLDGRWIPEKDLVFPIAHTMTSLGRDLHNAIVLFDKSVAPNHALIQYRHGSWQISNRTKRQPLYVDNKEVLPGDNADITPGQQIKMGEVSLQLVAPSHTPGERLYATPSAASDVSANILQTNESILSQILQRRWLGTLTTSVILIISIAIIFDYLIAFATHHTLLGSSGMLLATAIIPLIPVFAVFLLVMVVDRHERNPWYMLLLAFGLGVIIALLTTPAETPLLWTLGTVRSTVKIDDLPSLWTNTIMGTMDGLSIGLIEESVKGIALIAVLFFLRDRFENMVDGILYGMVIGAGFALVENVNYFSSANSQSSIFFLALWRIALGWLGHPIFTACIGATIGLARERGTLRQWWRLPLVGFLIAVLLHAFFDFVIYQVSNADIPDFRGAIIVVLVSVANYIPLFAAQAVLFVLLSRAQAHEAGILREYLGDEVQRGMVLPEEYVVLQRASFMQRLRRALLIGQNVRLWVAVRNLYSAEVQLAFAKWHLARGNTNGALISRIDQARSSIRDYHHIIASISKDLSSHKEGALSKV
jgi:RsiW-degrading membrane proteinase PrsW (M82 family)